MCFMESGMLHFEDILNATIVKVQDFSTGNKENLFSDQSP